MFADDEYTSPRACSRGPSVQKLLDSDDLDLELLDLADLELDLLKYSTREFA